MSSWDAAEKWYSACVGEKGHYYHQSIVLPNVIRMLNIDKNASLLDLGCGQGVLARNLPDTVRYTGIDLSEKLIAEAKRLTNRKNCTFLKADASADKLPLNAYDFDHACCILSLQNMQNGQGAVESAARHIKDGGRILLVLNHPCFRIPRQSGWGIDEKSSLQYRRMNGYMSFMNIPLQIHPGKGEQSEIFHSYHFPLSEYMRWLKEAGCVVACLEEWISDKKSVGAKAKMEDRARREIPLFLAIQAIKIKKSSH